MISLLSFRSFYYIITVFLFYPCLALAFDVTLTWNPNPDNIAGYKLYYGRESRNYSTFVDVGTDTTQGIKGLEDDVVYFFAVTAYDSANRESAYSDEITYPNDFSMNLLSNSGFEMGTLDDWHTKKGIFAINTQSANTGSYGIKVFNKGSIEQDFYTVKGRTYYVSVKMRVDRQTKKYSSGGLILRIKNKNGGTIARSPIVKLRNSSVGSWIEIRFSFIARDALSCLRFQNTGNFEVSADDFIVSPIPL